MSREAPPGIAWQVRGLWHVEGKSTPILTGDAIEPETLLHPGDEADSHSITILLPDGQNILYECFTAVDCARGFRVPPLYRKPEPFAVDILARIRAVLVRGNYDFSMPKAPLPRDEYLALLSTGNRVQVAGLAAKLPNGRYTYDLLPLNRAYPRQSHLSFEKSAPSITLALPSSGLYVVTITDELNMPRIHLFIAAVRPAQAASIGKSFREAEALLKQWNDEYFGWPVHEFQWAYLESLMMGAKPRSPAGPIHAVGASKASVLDGQSAADKKTPIGVTAEPRFSPQPGLYDESTAVTLRCATPGASMHFTVNGSQPVASSPVYSAPIMLRGGELIVKSFASAAGRKDSAVVTGIFRIPE